MIKIKNDNGQDKWITINNKNNNNKQYLVQ